MTLSEQVMPFRVLQGTFQNVTHSRTRATLNHTREAVLAPFATCPQARELPTSINWFRKAVRRVRGTDTILSYIGEHSGTLDGQGWVKSPVPRS